MIVDKKDNVLLAELDAKKRIQEVLQEKEEVLRKAKDKAKKELKSFDEDLNQKTRDRVTQLYIDRSETDKLDDITKNEILELEKNFQKNKKNVVDFLFNSVVNVTIAIPDVVIADFENKFK